MAPVRTVAVIGLDEGVDMGVVSGGTTRAGEIHFTAWRATRTVATTARIADAMRRVMEIVLPSRMRDLYEYLRKALVQRELDAMKLRL